MADGKRTRTVAILQALLITLLWSTSFILIKVGLESLSPLLFAGLRYTLATLCLLPFALQKAPRAALRHLDKGDWRMLLLLGLFLYAMTQGASFVGLSLLPAMTISLIFNFTPVLVALLSMAFVSEKPSGMQWLGILFFLVGVVTYFYPVSWAGDQGIGFMVILGGVVSNAISVLLGRAINRDRSIPPILVTTISMGFGAVLLLTAGLLTQQVPALGLQSLLILFWLAVVNTAFAFTLWNTTLCTLTAVESSIINGTMLVQVALLAWVFLGEALTLQQIAGMLASGLGALAVQLAPASPAKI